MDSKLITGPATIKYGDKVYEVDVFLDFWTPLDIYKLAVDSEGETYMVYYNEYINEWRLSCYDPRNAGYSPDLPEMYLNND